MRVKHDAKWADAYQWDRIERHLRETMGSLRSLYEYVLAKRDGIKSDSALTQGQFAVAYAHAYHHLNFAWNTRKMTEEVAEAGFEANEKWPKEFDQFLNDGQIVTQKANDIDHARVPEREQDG